MVDSSFILVAVALTKTATLMRRRLQTLDTMLTGLDTRIRQIDIPPVVASLVKPLADRQEQARRRGRAVGFSGGGRPLFCRIISIRLSFTYARGSGFFLYTQ